MVIPGLVAIRVLSVIPGLVAILGSGVTQELEVTPEPVVTLGSRGPLVPPARQGQPAWLARPALLALLAQLA